MNTNYLYEYVNKLERILSIAYEYKYSLGAVEKMISYSSFFQNIEKDGGSYAPITSEAALIKELFPDLNTDYDSVPTYNQCLWAAESYLRIQGKTGLTFECIFLYIPISKMYEYFPLYHEMDFSQIVQEFERLYKEKSVIAVLLDKYGYPLKEVSLKAKIPYDTLFGFKQRKRDISKANFETLYRLSRVFNVRMETISEVKIR